MISPYLQGIHVSRASKADGKFFFILLRVCAVRDYEGLVALPPSAQPAGAHVLVPL